MMCHLEKNLLFIDELMRESVRGQTKTDNEKRKANAHIGDRDLKRTDDFKFPCTTHRIFHSAFRMNY
jgi:hypothetical protein